MLLVAALACGRAWGETVGELSCGETQSGRLAATPDEWTMSAAAGEVVAITVRPDVTAPRFVPRWRLLDGDRHAVHLSNGSRRCVGRCVTDALPVTATYIISVSDPGRGMGGYSISLEAVSATANGLSNGPPKPACAREVNGFPDGTQPIVVGGDAAGTIQVLGETDTFTFAGDVGTRLTIGVQPIDVSDSFDPRWWLFAPDGTLVRTSDGAAGCLGACDTAPLPATGTFTLLVADGEDDSIGRYAIHVQLETSSTTTTTTTTTVPEESTSTTTEPPPTTTTTTPAGEPTTTTIPVFELSGTVESPAPSAVPERLGAALATDGTRLFIGAPDDDTAAAGAGAVLVVDVDTTAVPSRFGRLERTLTKPGTPAPGDSFGAALALLGSPLAVGAPGDGGVGAVWLFAAPDDPAPRAIVPAGLSPGARFGGALAGGSDGIVVGAPGLGLGDVPLAGRVFVLDATTGAVVRAIDRPDGSQPNDQFGFAVAVANGRLLVGAPCTVDRAGRAFLFDLATGASLASLQAPVPTPGDGFGAAVALVADQPVVGAPSTAGGTGAVFRFAPDGSSSVALDRPDAHPGDRFGAALVAADVGLLVGTPGEAQQVPGGGAVHRYDVTVDPWELEEVIRKPMPSADDAFGTATATAGGRVFVGTPGDDSGTPDGGAAFVFDGPSVGGVFRERLATAAFGAATATFDGTLLVGSPGMGTSGGSVSLVDRTTGTAGATIDNPGGAGARFGYAVAALGDEIVVGAPFQDGSSGAHEGAVYVFAGDGTRRLTLADPAPSAGGQFGFAVGAVAGDVLVGAPLADERDMGVAYLFDGASGARRVTYRKPAPATGDFFGAAVAGDGDAVLVGAPLDGTDGSAYLFRRDTAELVATLHGQASGVRELFGAAVAIAGQWIVVGAPLASAGAPESGVVHVFHRADGSLARTITNPTPDPGDHFGAAVALDGDQLLVGAPSDDAGALDTGAAHLFDASTGALLQTFRNPPQTAFDQFGFSVAVSASGLLVGSPGPSRVYLFGAAGTMPVSRARRIVVTAGGPRAIATTRVTTIAVEAAPGPRCGNGLVEAGEECDDGNDVDTDDCRSDCTRGPCCALDPRAAERCDDHNPCTDDILDPQVGCKHMPNGSCCQSDADCNGGECRTCVGCFLYEWDCCQAGSICLPDSTDACAGRTCLDGAFCRCEDKLDCGVEALPDDLRLLFGRACDQLRLELSVAPDGTPAGKAELTAARGRARSARQLLRKTARVARRYGASKGISRVCRKAVLSQVRAVRRAIPQGKRLRRCVLRSS